MKDTTHHSKPEKPANATRVARRSLVLAAVVCRGSIESNADQSEADSLHQRILEWLTRLALWDEVEPSEEKILHTPLGQLEPQDVIRATWYVEGLAILAWALKQGEFPRHDQQVDSPEVADSVWFLSEDAEELIRTARLRNRTQLRACLELQYAIHCRLRDFIRHREQEDFTRWVEKTWLDAIGLDAADLIVDNDLAIDGKAISDVKDNRVQDCASIAFQRHRAIIWLVEGYPIYSQTPVDT
jgi:hypothetical protein